MNEPAARVALRADASASLGIGHVKRCLALAPALREVGLEPCLVTRPGDVDVASLAGEAGIEVHLLPAAQAGSEAAGGDFDVHADARQTGALLSRVAPRWVVVDHYALDEDWHRHVAAACGCRIAVIDDLADRRLAADVLVDQNLAESDHARKYEGRLAAPARLLCGPRYALLGPGYADAPRHVVRDSVLGIGIFVGGTDPAGLNELALEACREHAGFEGPIELVTTRANPRCGELQRLAERWPQTQVRIDLPDLAAFFARHDLQIGAGGGASWERCCMGAPTLALVGAPNQLAVIPLLARSGAVATLPIGSAITAATVGRALRELIDDGARRAELGRRARALVDGRGAQRVALGLAADRLWLRRAEAGDCERLHGWRNDPVTRKVSVDAAPIALEAHRRWFVQALLDPHRLLLLGLVGTLAVGVIRFDRTDTDELEVSLYLDPALHGLGLGTRLLRQGESAARAWAAGARGFRATVLPGNLGSRRLFESAGYTFSGSHGHKSAAAFHAPEHQHPS